MYVPYRDVANIRIRIRNCGASASISTSASASAIINADIHADADVARVAKIKNLEEDMRELSNSHALISSVIPIIQILEKN